MASQGEKTGGNNDGEVKSTPSNQEVAPPLVSTTKGKKLYIFYICVIVLSNFVLKMFFPKTYFICRSGEHLTLA